MFAHYCHNSPGKGVKSEVFGNNNQLFWLAKKMTNCEEFYIYMSLSELTNTTQEQNLEIDSSVKCSAA